MQGGSGFRNEDYSYPGFGLRIAACHFYIPQCGVSNFLYLKFIYLLYFFLFYISSFGAVHFLKL